MCCWYLDLSLYKKVMEGKGGGLGCLKMHCGECSHLLLHSTLVGVVDVVDNKLGWRGVACKVWLLISWLAGIRFKFLSGMGLLFMGEDETLVESEVKTLVVVLGVVLVELLEVGW